MNRAIQRVAEKVGGGYRFPVGKPRRRGRPAPSVSELDALLTNLGADAGWAGQRNTLFFGILAATGIWVRARWSGVARIAWRTGSYAEMGLAPAGRVPGHADT